MDTCSIMAGKHTLGLYCSYEQWGHHGYHICACFCLKTIFAFQFTLYKHRPGAHWKAQSLLVEHSKYMVIFWDKSYHLFRTTMPEKNRWPKVGFLGGPCRRWCRLIFLYEILFLYKTYFSIAESIFVFHPHSTLRVTTSHCSYFWCSMLATIGSTLTSKLF